MTAVDLVLISIGGVQRFVAESRKTIDAAGASLVIRKLVIAGAHDLPRPRPGSPYGLIFPGTAALAGGTEVGVTNKIACLVEAQRGPSEAEAAAGRISAEWQTLVATTFPKTPPDTPGMPDIAWVSVTGDDNDYRALWKAAQTAMSQRRRVRTFNAGLVRARSALCAQSPQLPAEEAPTNSPEAHRGDQEKLSASGWVKRRVGREQQRFPSTTVIASAPFRSRLLDKATSDNSFRNELVPLVRDLTEAWRAVDQTRHRPLPGHEQYAPDLRPLSDQLGTAISPDSWEPDALRREHGEAAAEQSAPGRAASRRIAALARRHELAALTPYYAVLVQDLDRLGERMGTLELAEQRAASAALIDLGRTQLEIGGSRAHLGVPVYAGGDDYLAFVPAAHALGLATQVRKLVGDRLSGGPLAGATASTAIVFAHMISPLQQVIATAQEALGQAKDTRSLHGNQRDALTVVVLRRGGERARTILPWSSDPALTLERVAPSPGSAELSARLASRLEQDTVELDELAATPGTLPTLDQEIERLVIRQGGSAEVAVAIRTLGYHERGRYRPGPRLRFDAVPALLVARFLAQECR